MGTAIVDQHWQLEKVGDFVRDAAAAAARLGEPDTAVEWLEQGRSVVWTQTLNLRSPLDSLRARYPVIAEHLAIVSRDLDTSSRDTISPDTVRRDTHRTLSFQWDKLISEVRLLEGFEDFLGPKKIASLLPAASSCPVVVLNPCKTGCDALILMAEAGGVIHLSLPFTSDRADALLDSLEKAQVGRSLARYTEPIDRHLLLTGLGAVMRDPNERIRELLAELWHAVVKPVLDGLAYSVSHRTLLAIQLITFDHIVAT
jgi:hypothetical protein